MVGGAEDWLVVALLLVNLGAVLSVEEYNCTHRYTIHSESQKLEGNNGYCRDSCLGSVPNMDVSVDPECILLHQVLTSYNAAIVDGDCLELQFMPGNYWFSSLNQIQLSYSLVLTAPWGGASIACSQASENACHTSGEGSGGKFMMAVNGSLDRDVFVSIDSLDFSNCSKRIQLNLLSNVTVINSSFM